MENKDKFLEIEEKKDEAGLGNPEELKRTVCVIGHKIRILIPSAPQFPMRI